MGKCGGVLERSVAGELGRQEYCVDVESWKEMCWIGKNELLENIRTCGVPLNLLGIAALLFLTSDSESV